MIYKSKNRYKRSDFFYNFFPHLLLLLIILSCTFVDIQYFKVFDYEVYLLLGRCIVACLFTR